MKIICSWCRGEGQVGLVGEKAPLEDRRETHGICLDHQRAMRKGSTNYGSAQGFTRYGASREMRWERRVLAHLCQVPRSIFHACVCLTYQAWKVRF